MDVDIYDNSDDGAVKVFFVLREDEAVSVKVGNKVVPTERGYQFYVDEVVANQIDKVELYTEGGSPTLRLKDGEELDVPEKTEKELRIELLKKELAELESAE